MIFYLENYLTLHFLLNRYLKDLEKGTRVNPNMPTQQQAPQGQQAPQIDPKLLQYMTPEQRKLFGG